jgi:hypothetical protein
VNFDDWRRIAIWAAIGLTILGLALIAAFGGP